tara:strand:- start:2878 stop:3993 length:1116 start_codon:yes stop_codon:yes gene_type:complete
MDNLPTVSLITILHNWSNFCRTFEHKWNVLDYPKEKLEWIIVDTSSENHSDLIPLNDNILYIHIKSNEYLDKINFKNDDDKILWTYFEKTKRLPYGFMRDYAVGLSSNDYILHVDFDTIYGSNTIKRKLKFLNDKKLECTYCNKMLAYDIYGKELYKIETEKAGGYESTLFHTRGFWERGGFKWEDINNEGSSFCYGKGMERSMDNFYDSIKLLSIHNINAYRPIKVELENINVEIPEIVHTLEISEHPTSETLYNIFNDIEVNVVGINSEILEIIKKENWKTFNIDDIQKKVKEKVIIKSINELNLENIGIGIINTKYPIWSIFSKIDFDIVLLETQKNVDQMDSILKKSGYILFDNLYFNRKYLIKGKN